MPLYNKVIKDQEKTESWMEKEDYNFLERVKALGEAISKQPTLHPAQIAPSFFNEYKSFGDLREAYKSKTIGKEYINNELNKISAAWDILPDGGKRFVLGTLQTGSDLVGGTWEQMKTVEGAEKYDPTAWMTSWLAHGIDFTGDKLDKYVAKPTASFVHNKLGIDKRGADLTGLAAEMLVTRRLFKAVPQTINLINKGVASKQAHNLAFKAGKYADEALGSFKPANKRTISVIAENIDDVFSKDPKDVRAIIKIAKQNSISLSKAEDWLNLSRKGIVPKQSIKPGSNNLSTRNRISVNPLDDASDISYASIDDIKNAELALKAKGIAAPTTQNIYEYLSEYGGTFETFKPVTPPPPPPVNYKAIKGADKDSGNFDWLGARTGTPYYFDIGGHRIFQVPGMNTAANKTRYKAWLTNSLIDRYKYQATHPQLSLKRWAGVNRPFIDSKGMEWRLVRPDKNAVGAGQEFIPMPLNEIDSRALKAKNTSPTEKLILHRLYNLNVRDRNAMEKKYPWLREWVTDGIGENYHEHMFGLDEYEFFRSGYGKSLGYMNNDVFDIDKLLGNIVFLTDPRFKLMKDNIANYITPGKKVDIYPGMKRRESAVKRFKAGPYKGLNAIVGYDANPKSNTFTDITIYAYNEDPDIVEGFRVATIPNYYANVYAKINGKSVMPKELADDFIQEYVEAVLNNEQPAIIALNDMAEYLIRKYPQLNKYTFDLANPGGLRLDVDFRHLGEPSTKTPQKWADIERVLTDDIQTLRKAGVYDAPIASDTDLRLKEFITTDENQKEFVERWARMLDRIKHGKYKQLRFDLIDSLFPDENVRTKRPYKFKPKVNKTDNINQLKLDIND